MEKEILNAQREHWEETFARKPEMFGDQPSEAARKATDIFKKEGRTKVLELGCGEGRDTIYFARNGIGVAALDYSREGLEAVSRKAREAGLEGFIETRAHDIRNPLPFDDNLFDACFSHMLFCMALTTAELQSLSSEIRRVLTPGGLNIYTVRHTGDAHYKQGIHRGEDMYETAGFIVHFFTREKVELLAKGYEIVSVDEFEEGRLPRKLFRVTLKKIS